MHVTTLPVYMDGHIESQSEAELFHLREMCEQLDKLISRHVRKSTIDQTDPGRKLSKDYRRRIQAIRREVDEVEKALLHQSATSNGLGDAYVECQERLKAIWSNFEDEFTKAKRSYDIWTDSVAHVPVSPSWSEDSAEEPLLKSPSKRDRARMSMPAAPSQLLGKGVPFEAQFGHVPRRKQKGGFFSFGSSDTSDSDLDGKKKPLRPPVMWGPM